ncbi:hypothetical protein N473_07600 [Pseudoalteromonas luteoviolacea CPMOR-1]|uniref:Uncharacterized protein n=1 Tax=Pseudoalteromonas luteoviolacea CPMOR-1 TaxID=1365248 RepID=A0A167NHF5_9GAMM|nr:hypothetical protein [Pseudoalteromonas luteoviolacea]KZN68282.1 hypothetical protein N473_07600 [Pseudoalteromonas luteoviolacea CPMOR-1]
MKLKLQKGNLKNLSNDNVTLNKQATKQINGGIRWYATWECTTGWHRCEP